MSATETQAAAQIVPAPNPVNQRIRLAETPPVRCASCYAQQPQERHVDFGSSFDGPVFPEDTRGVTPVVIDELVICEACLKEAFGALGLQDSAQARDGLQRLQSDNQGLHEKLVALTGAYEALERSLKARDTLTEIMRPSPPAAAKKRASGANTRT